MHEQINNRMVRGLQGRGRIGVKSNFVGQHAVNDAGTHLGVDYGLARIDQWLRKYGKTIEVENEAVLRLRMKM